MAGSSGKQTRSQQSRQKMINMMYLVFIAMLALQISKEVLATLGILSEDMEKSTAELKISIDNAYTIINQNSNQDYYKIPSEELPNLKGATDEYFNFLQSLKDSLIGMDDNNYMIDVEYVDENGEEKVSQRRDYQVMDKSNYLDEMFFVSGLTESGMKIDEKDQTEHHKKMFELSDKLVKELKESDVIIISAPIYNYGPPATLKAWSDLAARIGETFRFKPNGRREGLLKNKHAYLVITSGGTQLNSSEDFLTPWLKFILNFFGIEKVDIVSADQMALDYEKSISDAEAQIEKLFKD